MNHISSTINLNISVIMRRDGLQNDKKGLKQTSGKGKSHNNHPERSKRDLTDYLHYTGSSRQASPQIM